MACQFADWVSFLIKFLFIFCHNIIRRRPIRVKVKGVSVQNPARFTNLLQGEVKERAVICLELKKAVRRQEMAVTFEKFQGGQASSGMSVFGPWV